MSDSLKTYGVLARDRGPLVNFMVRSLESKGCRMIFVSPATTAPFRLTFETPQGERLGVVAYAFLANTKPTRNRPADEHRFQIKYGGDLSGLHRIWQDPYGLYVTLLVGIDPAGGYFVAADPVLHDPTRFSVSVELKNAQVAEIQQRGWFAWERERRVGAPRATGRRAARGTKEHDEPLFEVLVGGLSEHFLRLVRFERETLGEAAGERHFLAESFTDHSIVTVASALAGAGPSIAPDRLHALAAEFALPEGKVLDLIAERRMLKMAVRGSVAEEHLLTTLRAVPGVKGCRRLTEDHGPDVSLSFRRRPITIECKNSSRVRTADGWEKIDLQRTRAAKSNPCSRYYKSDEFDLVAACIHAVTGRWEFKFARSRDLDAHGSCEGRLSNNVKLDKRWTTDAHAALERVLARDLA